ncbi:MAG: hypothetical protein GY820_21560, partial [Gammaproteobacteria bacterium]|nr:hypothetical protein [Gammaproteobacteria bacterium]
MSWCWAGAVGRGRACHLEGGCVVEPVPVIDDPFGQEVVGQSFSAGDHGPFQRLSQVDDELALLLVRPQ